MRFGCLQFYHNHHICVGPSELNVFVGMQTMQLQKWSTETYNQGTDLMMSTTAPSCQCQQPTVSAENSPAGATENVQAVTAQTSMHSNENHHIVM